MYPSPRSSESETPGGAPVVSNQGQMSPKHPNPFTALAVTSHQPWAQHTARRRVWTESSRPGFHHGEQSRAPEQPMSPFQEQPNNAIQEGRKHVRSSGVERSTSSDLFKITMNQIHRRTQALLTSGIVLTHHFHIQVAHRVRNHLDLMEALSLHMMTTNRFIQYLDTITR
ncbi:hypothetical protein AZE42_12290 [Rhizopogon vesiculosus]|uniref:Uncharacterized protein n=1 Tax=Rhizopogon vesiculosus TaxID=180088 RepID=A0A1J8Q8X9_9AGAM|nr:hypothetical protein AZE42_12290 [Rhizopogon vesiculosus]